MDKNIIRIFILGFIWVATGIIINLTKKEDGAGILALAIGLSIESVALILFFWRKIKNK
ncbi:hypothetical protein [Flavicella sp.]|uniref:hypothetical protein n=1 Tax=Flavicella sp. TaxID=2957742 RepID=UPI003016F7AD